MKERRRNPKGRPVTDAVAAKLGEIIHSLNDMTAEELAASAHDLSGLSESNCSWVAYQYKDTIARMLAEAISEKERADRRARVRLGMDLS